MIRQKRFAAIGASKNIAAPSTSSQSVQFGTDASIDNGTGVTDCLVINDTDKLGFFAFGKGSATATNASIPLRAGASIIIEKGQADFCAAIMDSAPTAGKFYFQAGVGG